MFWIRLIRPFLHFVLIFFVFFLVIKLRQITDLIPFVHLKIPAIDVQETLLYGFVSALIFVFLGLFKGLYELQKPIHNYWQRFFKVFLLWFVLITFVAFFGYGYVFKNGISRLIIFWSVFFSFFVLIVLDFILNLVNSKLEEKKPYKIGVWKTEFFSEIKNLFKNYKIYQIEEFSDLNDIKKFDLIFLVGNYPADLIEEIMDVARLHQVQFYHIPDVKFLDDILYQPERIGPLIAWRYKPSPLEGWWKVFKRIFDIVFSLVFILLFWWLYVLIALWIYFHDKGKIFYVSKRVGQGGKLINVYKFRTMVENADEIKKELMDKNERDDVLFKISNDPRVKPWGKFLRKTSLDEIPQFFNVLKGDMSIAGPRPHLPEEVEKYKKWQKRLLAAKPGITGYAQIFGRDLPFEQEAKLDLYRFQNWSVWLDLVVVLGVFRTLFKGK